jgi:hypothetical protein
MNSMCRNPLKITEWRKITNTGRSDRGERHDQQRPRVGQPQRDDDGPAGIAIVNMSATIGSETRKLQCAAYRRHHEQHHE